VGLSGHDSSSSWEEAFEIEGDLALLDSVRVPIAKKTIKQLLQGCGFHHLKAAAAL
jgi:hypothetical protein